MADDAACVVVTYDALPWLEQCLASVAGVDTVVVDHGSSDGTVAFVRERFPAVRVVEAENRGLAAGWNRGVAETSAAHVLILNADAWLVGAALASLLEVAGRYPRAAVVAPRLRYPDGSLQRSARGFPSLWRIATEYLYLRKLAPRSRAVNAYYAGDFDHDEERVVDWVMGSCFLLRRSVYDEVGPFDERFNPAYVEDTDYWHRAWELGIELAPVPAGRVTHARRTSADQRSDWLLTAHRYMYGWKHGVEPMGPPPYYKREITEYHCETVST